MYVERNTRRAFQPLAVALALIASAPSPVRAEDVERLEALAGDAGYTRALRLAFERPPCRDLSWRGREALFNQGLPKPLQINRRALSRIVLGHDRELERAVRVLLAFEMKLGLSLRDLYRSEEEQAGEQAER